MRYEKKFSCFYGRQFLFILFSLSILVGNIWADADRTYEIVINAYCDPAADPEIACGQADASVAYCCHGTRNDFEQFYHDQIPNLNKIYQSTGISFRIAEFKYNFTDVRYARINWDLLRTDEGKQLVRELQQQAASDPDRINLYVLGGGGLGGGFSQIPIYNDRAHDDDYYGIFVGAATVYSDLAHELGHYFCLAHPFTFLDRPDMDWDGNEEPDGNLTRPVSHDGDGLADTPEDPGIIENNPIEAGHDCNGSCYTGFCSESIWSPNHCTSDAQCEQTGSGECVINRDRVDPSNVIDGHEWCEITNIHNDVDSGSPMTQYCDITCFIASYGALPTYFHPDGSLIISYYKGVCNGPYVVDGNRKEAFTGQQLEMIQRCNQTVPERQSLTNVCENRGGDTDNDGTCDMDDICPYADDDTCSSTDLDGDNIVNGIDNCPTIQNVSQFDLDADGEGDECDFDDDGDGCIDLRDDDPRHSQRRVSYIETPLCEQKVRSVYGPAGQDSDNDGVLDCDIESTDDDDDGIPDSEDPCPTIKADRFDPTTGQPEQNWSDCVVASDARACPPLEIEQCLYGCNLSFLVKLVSRVNPADMITFDNFMSYGDTLYFPALAGITVSQTARLFSGGTFRGEISKNTIAAKQKDWNVTKRPPLALELWSRSPAKRIRVLAEFWPDSVLYRGIANGRALAVRILDRNRIEISAVWSMGFKKGDIFLDRDGDDVPDPSDNCQNVPNKYQRDRDRDRIGDACDPDFDQSGYVTRAEVLYIQDCLGVDPKLRANYLDIQESNLGPPNPPIADLIKAYRCREADLNNDGMINNEDLGAAFRLLEKVPGPSGIHRIMLDEGNIRFKK